MLVLFICFSKASMISINLHPLGNEENRLEHCRALSSDEDSICEAESEVNNICQGHNSTSLSPDLHSSGYSSVQSVSPSSSSIMPSPVKTFTGSLGVASANAHPGFRLLVPMQRHRGTSSKQVKRKNAAAHSGSEMEK